MRPTRSVYRPKSAVGSAALAAATAAALVGCQPPPKKAAPPPEPPPVPTANDAMQTQRQMAAIDPHARVGRVATVSDADHLAVVSRIPFADVKVGDPISFTGTDNRPFATGTITDLDDHTSPGFPFLIVDYQKASPDGRDPVAGDQAITIPMGK